MERVIDHRTLMLSVWNLLLWVVWGIWLGLRTSGRFLARIGRWFFKTGWAIALMVVAVVGLSATVWWKYQAFKVRRVIQDVALWSGGKTESDLMDLALRRLRQEGFRVLAEDLVVQWRRDESNHDRCAIEAHLRIPIGRTASPLGHLPLVVATEQIALVKPAKPIVVVEVE